MPEYLAPGVYVEEVSFRPKSIEGVGTSTTGFVGPTRRGPYRADAASSETPELLTSLADFERIYGSLTDLDFGAGVPRTNQLAHAVRAYFNEGGARLYVCRVPGPGAATASVAVGSGADAEAIRFVARSPGSGGNGRVDLTEVRAAAARRTMDTAPEGTLLRTDAGGGAFNHHVKVGDQWRAAANPDDAAAAGDTAALAGAGPQILTMTVSVRDADGIETTHEGLGYDRRHRAWIGGVLAARPSRRAEHLTHPVAIEIGAGVSPAELRAALFPTAPSSPEAFATARFQLAGGTDGGAPNEAAYSLALGQLAGLEDVAIVAAPGSSAYADADAIRGALIAHAEAPRAYRIAVLDTAPGITPSEAREVKSRIDSSHAAIYYPWVVVSNPLARPGAAGVPAEIALAPSGFVCGIYARNDAQRGVWKAPANEVVRGALRFESDVNFAQQGVLNPLGVNCLRFLPGRGMRVWGARTISSDPEWKYVNVRRYFNYLEASIDRGTQWAVFEPNGEALWANVRETILAFLYNEWRNGALLGGKPEEAYFVRCDRTTMTQNDLDNGRLICLVGVAPIRPAEFVVFRVGQKTADARA